MPANDFDFWIGTWTVHNRRLKARLVGSTEWETFDARSTARRLLSGFGNEDEFRSTWRGGFIGTSLRIFDPVSQRWFIYWADDANRAGLQPPVVGCWSGERGLFEGDDVFEGTPIRVRFLWARGPGARAHWEQAFSPDGGATWETNWTMDMERV